MTVSAYAHIEHSTDVAVNTHIGGSVDYAILEAGGLTLIIHSRAKALEIASLLESAAQKWEVGHEYGECQQVRNCEVIKGGEV